MAHRKGASVVHYPDLSEYCFVDIQQSQVRFKFHLYYPAMVSAKADHYLHLPPSPSYLRGFPSVHLSRAPVAHYLDTSNFPLRWHSLPSSLARPSPLMSRQKPSTVRHFSESSLPVRDCFLSRRTFCMSKLTTIPQICSLDICCLLSSYLQNRISDYEM